jgi:hypothetical protein
VAVGEKGANAEFRGQGHSRMVMRLSHGDVGPARMRGSLAHEAAGPHLLPALPALTGDR